MKRNIFIGIILLLIISIIVFIVFLKGETSNLDVNSKISDISNLSNVHVKVYDCSNDNLISEYFKKDNMVKSLTYRNQVANRAQVYNTNTKEYNYYYINSSTSQNLKGTMKNLTSKVSNYLHFDYNGVNILDVNDNPRVKYEVSEDNIDGKKCIKVDLKDSEKIYELPTMWIDLDTNFVIKTSYFNSNSNHDYKYVIELGVVTDDEFNIPNNIIFKTNNI